jgi:trimeric autotransporter adhesin
MAVTNFSPLLGLALPTTGDLSGTWGTTVNDSITSLIDSAVAGTTTLSADADVTLSTTNGAANQARNAIILWTASNGATTRNITAPAQSKAYLVINAGTGSIVIRGSGPTTGVTVASGVRALVAWNGSDFVKVVSNPVVLTTDVSGTLPIANGGTGTTSTTFANLTTNVTGLLPVANGGTGTATPSLVQGTNVTITGTWPNQTIAAAGGSSGITAGQSIAFALIFSI